MAGLRQHGGAVDVVANTDLEKDVPVYIAGFHGFTLDRAEENEAEPGVLRITASGRSR